MPTDSVTLILVAACAALAPVLARGVGRYARVPVVVFEILLGLLVGPALLGWAHPDAVTEGFADFGLAMLFFLAGSEIDVLGIRGRPFRTAVIGWLVSLGLGVVLGAAFAPSAAAGVFIGIALTSTALGTILPTVRDAGELKTPFGRAVSAVGTVGEFGPLVAISVFLSGRAPGRSTVVLLLFVAIAGLALFLAARHTHPRMHAVIEGTLRTSGQFAVRLVLLVLAVLVALSIFLDLDMLLGAFAAGLLFRTLMRDASRETREQVESKVDAVGYGFLVPVFFVSTGLTFDLDALLDSPRALVLLPVFLVLLLVVRGGPSMLSAPEGADRREKISLGLFGATGLPIIVAVTAIGVETGDLSSATAASLVGAGLLSVLLFPLLALMLRGTRPRVRAQGDDLEAPEVA
ncbi:cation:proton antiporter [Luteimicrobium subarcticum]|uniref:Transporter (CPA2 family) n=1 Tax=Luteimicrobium subarcticum TaxID=620910 RepID=A0A2M8WQT0_9MICO|nr:cation:proton antiporter [Luteimicrobium subarcticum]PJI93298.1 transporter (CPA2 family) [Luteimicrobium subarcticum]